MVTTVLIVDDHPSFRTSARRVLEDAGYTVIGEAQDGESALAAARALHPAIILLDVHLPDLDGFEVARRLAGDGANAGAGDGDGDGDGEGDAPAVVLTSSRDIVELGGMIAGSGARGFLPKDELSGPALAALLR